MQTKQHVVVIPQRRRAYDERRRRKHGRRRRCVGSLVGDCHVRDTSQSKSLFRACSCTTDAEFDATQFVGALEAKLAKDYGNIIQHMRAWYDSLVQAGAHPSGKQYSRQLIAAKMYACVQATRA